MVTLRSPCKTYLWSAGTQASANIHLETWSGKNSHLNCNDKNKIFKIQKEIAFRKYRCECRSVHEW